MKLVTSLMSCMLLTGCVATDIPISHVESGHKYGDDAIAFLDDDGTTRAEVVANLGPPTEEFSEAGVMAYTWVTSRPFGGLYLIGKDPGPVTAIEPKELRKTWALLIAYDSHQNVIAHTVCSFPASENLKAEALKWARTKSK